MTNSLLNKSKKELDEQHRALVEKLMALWSIEHRMQDWVSPLQAVGQMQLEAYKRRLQ